MSDVFGNWPVTGYVALVNNPIVTSDYFVVDETPNPGEATVSFVDTAPNGGPVTLTARVSSDGRTLSGNAVVGNYAYYVTAMVEVVGAPTVLYRTINGAVLRTGGGTEDSGGQWGGGPLKPK